MSIERRRYRKCGQTSAPSEESMRTRAEERKRARAAAFKSGSDAETIGQGRHAVDAHDGGREN